MCALTRIARRALPVLVLFATLPAYAAGPTATPFPSADAEVDADTLAPGVDILVGLGPRTAPGDAADDLGATLVKVVESSDGALRFAAVRFPARVPVPESDMLVDIGVTGIGRGVRYYPMQAGIASAEPLYQPQATSHLNTLEAPGAWGVSTGTGATIAMLDTGADCKHADLAGAWPPSRIAGIPYLSYDAIGNRYGGGCTDVTGIGAGHGTTTAGLACARVNGKLGAGVAYGARCIPVKVSTGHVDSIDAIEAVIWATENGADVMNMSFGTYLGRLGPDRVAAQAYDISSLCLATTWAFGKGTITTAAVGNDGANRIVYPSGCDQVVGLPAPPGYQVIGVGALAERSMTARWTVAGGGSTRGAHVDVMAPGEALYGIQKGGTYGVIGTGTSWSSAEAAGGAALLYGAAYAAGMGPAHRPLIARQVARVMQDTADPLGQTTRRQGETCVSRRNIDYGCGRLDLSAAVTAMRAWAAGYGLPAPTLAPGVTPTATTTPEAGIGGTEEATATATHVPAVLTALATIRGSDTPTPTPTDDPDRPTPTPDETQALATEIARWLTALAPTPTVDVAATLTALVPPTVDVPGTLTAIATTPSPRDRAIMTLTAMAPRPTGTPTPTRTPTATAVPTASATTFASILQGRSGQRVWLPWVGQEQVDPWGGP